MALGNQTIIGLVLFVILVAGVLICSLRGGALEKFIVTVDDVQIPDQCPDYMTTDGAKYYLVWNNRPLDGKTNPLTFDTQAGAFDWLAAHGCPQLEPMPLTRITNPADPTVSYERECNKQTANPNYWIGRCAFDKIFESRDTDSTATGKNDKPGQKNNNAENNNAENNKLTAADLENLRPELLVGLSQDKIKTDGYVSGLGSDTYGYLRRINNALTNMDTPELVNYDVETCMFDKLSKDMPQLGSADGLQRFRRYYNQQIANTVSRNPGQDEADVILTPASLAEFDKYFQEANDLSITNDMMIKLFGTAETP
jgi:hypothetical protein